MKSILTILTLAISTNVVISQPPAPGGNSSSSSDSGANCTLPSGFGYKLEGTTTSSGGVACVAGATLIDGTDCHVGPIATYDVDNGDDQYDCDNGTLTSADIAVNGCDGSGYYASSGSVGNSDLVCTAHGFTACTGNQTDGSARKVQGTATADASCTDCDANSYGPADGSTNCVPHTTCGNQTDNTVRTTTTAATTTADAVCEACDGGSYGVNAGDCTACATVTNADSSATYTCTSATTSSVSACADGFWKDTTGAADVCTACATVSDSSARTCNAAGAAGIQTVTCDNGFYESGTAGTDLGCTVCAAVSDSSARTCNATGATGIQTVTCNSNYYQSGAANNDLGCTGITVCGNQTDNTVRTTTTAATTTADAVCEACKAGSYGVNAGDCTACAVGDYQGSTGQSSCNTCTGGTSGTTGSTGMTSCSDCGPAYGVKSGQTAGSATYCEACDPTADDYEFSADTDSDACDVSSVCAIGKGITAGTNKTTATCANCPSNTYSNSNTRNVCHAVASSTGIAYLNISHVQCAIGYSGSPTYNSDGSYNNGCTACAAGSSKAAVGDVACTVCANGKWQNETAQASCNDVDNGHDGQNSGGAYAATGAVKQGACAAGKFNANGDGQCATCAAGSVTNAATGATTCTACAAGTYSAVSTSACQACAAGSVTDTLTNTSATTCTVCAAGTYSANSQNACQACAAGSETDTLTNTSATTCTACVAGKFSANSQTACAVCVNGKYQNSQGQAACLDVADGKEGQNSGGSYVATGAVKQTACPAGQYNTNGDGACAACADGSITNTLTGTGAKSCTACAAGTVSPNSQTACANCDAGKATFNSTLGATSGSGLTGQTSCTACTDGTYQDQAGQGVCKDVANGKFGSKDGSSYTSSGATSEQDCAAGDYNTDGTGDCATCVAGSVSNAGASSCTDCTAGKFSAVSTTACADCDAGKATFNSTLGATSGAGLSGQTSCTACPDGTYQDGTGKGVCKDVQNGYFGSTDTSRGTDATLNSESCTSCAEHASTGGATKEYQCFKGTFNADGTGDCDDCAAGTYQDEAGKTSCKNIEAGYEGKLSGGTRTTGSVRQDQCTGYTWSAGSDAKCKPTQNGFGATGCSAAGGGGSGCTGEAACAEGSYNDGSNNFCTGCEIGKYQDGTGATTCKDVDLGYGATDSSGSPVIQDAVKQTLCPEGQYQNGVAVNDGASATDYKFCRIILEGQKCITTVGSNAGSSGTASAGQSGTGCKAVADCGIGFYSAQTISGSGVASRAGNVGCTAIGSGKECTSHMGSGDVTDTSTQCNRVADCGLGRKRFQYTITGTNLCQDIGGGFECTLDANGNAADENTTNCRSSSNCNNDEYSTQSTLNTSATANVCQDCVADYGEGAWGSASNTACGHCIAGYGVGSGLGTAGSLGHTCEKCAFPEYNDVISNSACANMACGLGKGIVSNPGQLEDHNNCTSCVKPYFSDSNTTGQCEVLDCAPGYWFNWTDTSTRPNCVKCDTGYALVSSGQHHVESCTAHRTCPAGQGQDVVPDHETDRTCQVCVVDTHPFGANINASYSNVDDGTNCVDSLGACGTNQYYVPGNATHDRECKSCVGKYAVKDKASHHDLHCEVLVAEARVAGVGTATSVQTNVQSATEALLSGAGVAVREAKTLSDPYGRRVEVTVDGTDIVVKVWLDDVLADGTTPAIEDENKAVVDNLVVSGATVSFANSACYTWAPKDGSISQNTGCHPVLGNGEHCSPVCDSGYSLVSNSTCVGGVYTAGGCLSPDESKLSFAVELMDKVKLAATPKDRIAIMKTKSGGLTHAEKRKTIQYLFTEESGNFELDLDDSFIGSAFKAHLQAESKTKLTYIKLKSKANDQDCANADVDIKNSPDAWVLSVSESETGLICRGSGTDIYKKPVATIKWNREDASGNDIYDISCWSSFLQKYSAPIEKADGTSFDCKAEYPNSPTFWVGSLSSSTCKPVATIQGSIMRQIGDCPTTLQAGQTCQPSCPGYYYMDTVGSCDAQGNYVEPICKYSCDETISLWRANGCCSADKDDTCKLLKQRFKNHNCCP